ncbi:MAG: PD-(D/E)XK nuclease family protein [Alphaproteobacteria bacterium]|nr:PD-(D/E)XK nuclease family protein [Alphaproteobacteria bacterium]
MNVLCCSNPIKILEGLLQKIHRPGSNDYSRDIIFMPSVRSISEFTKMLVLKTGGAVLLPKFVALGEGTIDTDEDPIPKLDRVLKLAKKIKSDFGYGFSNALNVAAQLVQTADYLATEEVPLPLWQNLIPENFAGHFYEKARLLSLMKEDEFTEARKRIQNIRSWIPALDKGNFDRVFACGSTGSIPATRDLITSIAKRLDGIVILPGKIIKMPGNLSEGHPYWAISKLLENIGIKHDQIGIIDTGKSNIDCLNSAFEPKLTAAMHTMPRLIECDREADEMAVAANIVIEAHKIGKSVIAVSTDVGACSRLVHNLNKMGLQADLSIGQPAFSLPLARLLIMIMEIWTNASDRVVNTVGILKHKLARNYPELDKFIKDNMRDKPGQPNSFYKLDKALYELFQTPKSDFKDHLIRAAEYITDIHPDLFSTHNLPVWNALEKAEGETLADFKAAFEHILKGEKIRTNVRPNSKISVLGTIEARMIPADVVVICGLNEGMFPKKGFALPWLGNNLSKAAGLPSSDRKTGLMALDFINLSCCGQVFWTRSKTIGSAPATKSRFLSRVEVKADIPAENYKPVIPEFIPMQICAPRPAAISDPVYATHIDTLFHNPFEFYAKHILGLRPESHIRDHADARDYGNLVHSVIEDEAPDSFIERAAAFVPKGSAEFYFWSKRFAASRDIILEMLAATPGAKSEITGQSSIEGRTVKTRADRVWNDIVIDVKTGGAPGSNAMNDGMQPQLPIAAYIFKAKKMQFIDLKKNRVFEYEDPAIIIKVIEKCRELFKRLSVDGAEYPFVPFGEAKHHYMDHLYRV